MGLLVRIWVSTLRVRVETPEGFVAHRARAFAFFHGQQMALLGARKLARGAVVLVSRSRDGDLQAGVMTALGFRVLRGSSSRGGAPALSGLVRALAQGEAIAVSVDGPRGPRYVAKAGVAAAASAAAAALYPAASAARRALTLARTWDGFEVPLPFSTVAVVVGAAVSAAQARREPARLAAAIADCRARAALVAQVAPVKASPSGASATSGGARRASGAPRDPAEARP
ncbi:MAG TPA: DUF374 domain-containing protein [Polyangiaceae bacterium]|nr:DUF374 domain-containing protein [Polyangiaceae bacterium]